MQIYLKFFKHHDIYYKKKGNYIPVVLMERNI